jgi:hypothetical protein
VGQLGDLEAAAEAAGVERPSRDRMIESLEEAVRTWDELAFLGPIHQLRMSVRFRDLFVALAREYDFPRGVEGAYRYRALNFRFPTVERFNSLEPRSALGPEEIWLKTKSDLLLLPAAPIRSDFDLAGWLQIFFRELTRYDTRLSVAQWISSARRWEKIGGSAGPFFFDHVRASEQVYEIHPRFYRTLDAGRAWNASMRVIERFLRSSSIPPELGRALVEGCRRSAVQEVRSGTGDSGVDPFEFAQRTHREMLHLVDRAWYY